MRILFITSGFRAVYSFFERSIVEAFQNAGHYCESFGLRNDLQALQQMEQSLQPDLILAMTGLKIPKPILEFLRQTNVKSAVWMTEDPYYMDWTLPLTAYFDYIFTIDQAAAEQYTRLGHPCVYHLPLGTDPGIFHCTPVSEEFTSDIGLVGVPYSNRIELIELLLKNTDYTIQIVGRGWGKHHLEWNRTKAGHVHLVNAWVKPETAMKYYNGSTIVLNIHRPSDEKYNKNRMGIMAKSINNRTFDAASCEAFQLIDSREGLVNHFAEGKEMVSFEDKNDLLEKIHYYIAHGEERKHIARQARKRVLSSHTFQHRIDRLVKTVQSEQ
ncbi:CgeB family protein [Paenibacillus tianjinensis]|uniref:Glycosyltransferase n=1 Tax=Paenibacillus tianjinensis TaxID=2810347 RepID=A0ABX7L8S7_9BACL|nr:glycosyltransferase [Paenibacillus tianjinensis]QSF43803.1 glycosyltransferase [Paenibacillus tianjinensis]